jgi:hypothetical protein
MLIAWHKRLQNIVGCWCRCILHILKRHRLFYNDFLLFFVLFDVLKKKEPSSVDTHTHNTTRIYMELHARVGATFLIFTTLPLPDMLHHMKNASRTLQISSLSSMNSVTAMPTLMTASLARSVSSTSIAHNLQEWPTHSACFTSPRKPRENA